MQKLGQIHVCGSKPHSSAATSIPHLSAVLGPLKQKHLETLLTHFHFLHSLKLKL